MAEKDPIRDILAKARDAVTNHDEKEAIDAAMKRVTELEQKLAQSEQKAADAERRATANAQKASEVERRLAELQTSFTKNQAELATAKRSLTEAETRSATFRNELESMRSAQMKSASAEAAQTAAAEAARKRVIAEHTVAAGETLSHLALKYYGSSGEAYWRTIYEANKEVIGANPGMIRTGMVLNIPVKPENLK